MIDRTKTMEGPPLGAALLSPGHPMAPRLHALLPMPLDRRHIAVSLAGFCAFLDLYAPQSILPMLAQEFGATAGDVGLTVSATTFAIALIAPFTGAVADMLGR